MYRHFIKHIGDFVISFLGIILSLPVSLILILLLSGINSGSVFFVQVRPGKKGRLLKLIKFKTMNDKKDISGNLLPDNERITTIGNFIRKTSLDELPQLLNVFIGDMSLVGPRPLLKKYLPLYNEHQARRHEVRPGITGWAQVNGRNAISWQEKFEYDVWYVDNMSFWLDMKILFLTVKKVIFREGINAEDEVTMEEFRGNDFGR